MSEAVTDRLRLDGFKLKHLRMLVALDEHKKIGTVAELFGLSQPSLSRTLLELEALAGHPLFERHNRGTSLTPAGEVLVRHARSLLAEAGRAEHEINLVAAGRRGSVTIGTIMTPASEFIVPALASVQRDHPDLDFNVTEGSSDVLLTQLTAGQLDFAVCRIPQGFNEAQFNYVPLGSEALRIVVAPTHDLAGRASVSPADLEQLDWVLQPNGSAIRQVMDDYHRRLGIIPRSIVSTASVLLTMLLVRQNQRIGIFAKPVAELLEDHGLLRSLAIDTDIVMPGFGLVRVKGRALSPQAAILYTALRSQTMEI
jgi:DNA-binding transcriptional LysR family regulator